MAPILFGALLFIFISLGDFRYIVMFPFVLLCVIMGFALFTRIKGGESKKELNTT
jgi:hypothetical protein